MYSPNYIMNHMFCLMYYMLSLPCFLWWLVGKGIIVVIKCFHMYVCVCVYKATTRWLRKYETSKFYLVRSFYFCFCHCIFFLYSWLSLFQVVVELFVGWLTSCSVYSLAFGRLTSLIIVHISVCGWLLDTYHTYVHQIYTRKIYNLVTTYY